MNEQDLRNESQKYLDEMMKFYSLNKSASVSTPDTPPESVPLQAVSDSGQPEEPQIGNDSSETSCGNASEDISEKEINENETESAYDKTSENNAGKEVSFESRFPVPVIPDFIRSQSGIDDTDNNEESEEDSSCGFLKVEVRTGENGIPVPDAAVTISLKNGGNEKIIFTGTSGQSGELPKIKLPAPVNKKDASPESFENYSVYTVSVFARDFYREISADVPVFAGITSIQRFNLIPLPFHYDDNGQSIINRNTEPKI